MPKKNQLPGDSKELDPELIAELDRRLARIEGHVRGVRKMLTDQRNCDDILTQVAGVKAAVNQMGIRLLEGHLECCMIGYVGGGDGSEQVERFKDSLRRVLRS